jgi:hypothetical protein
MKGRPRTHNKREGDHMKELFAVVLSVAVALSLSPAIGTAQTKCPAEVAQAKSMLSKKTASVKPDDVQAPRTLAGSRGNENVQSPRGNQDVQSPRGNQNVQSPRGNQDVQSPRGNQDVQSPRGNQDVQSPRGNQDVQSPRSNQNVQSPRGNQDVQSPRGNQDVQSPRAGAGATTSAQAPRADMKKATSLVKEAEAACKAGNMTLASEKAKAALALLK